MSLLSPPSFTEARLYLRQNGPWRSLAKFVGGYIAGWQRWYVTLESLAACAESVPATDAIEFRFARVSDLPRMQRFMVRMAPSVLRAWLGPDYFFFVALINDEPVSYRCLSRRIHPGVSEVIHLRPDQLFMVDEYTTPEFRRRGITRGLAAGMLPVLQELGIREVLGVHRIDNHDTIAAIRKKGIPRVGTIHRCRIFWHVWFKYEAHPTNPDRLGAGLGGWSSGAESRRRAAGVAAVARRLQAAQLAWSSPARYVSRAAASDRRVGAPRRPAR